MSRDLLEVAQELTCPVCLQVPRNGGLFQCSLGHPICESCFGALANRKCPTCRADFVLTQSGNPPRIRLAETLLNAAIFPCRYQKEGCTEKLKIQEEASHASLCAHQGIICRICNEATTMHAMIPHLVDDHGATEVENRNDLYRQVELNMPDRSSVVSILQQPEASYQLVVGRDGDIYRASVSSLKPRMENAKALLSIWIGEESHLEFLSQFGPVNPPNALSIKEGCLELTFSRTLLQKTSESQKFEVRLLVGPLVEMHAAQLLQEIGKLKKQIHVKDKLLQTYQQDGQDSRARLKAVVESGEGRGLERGESRYLVCPNWYQRLKQFLSEDGDRPGAVDNLALLDESGEIRSEMIADLDYATVPEDVWECLVTSFGSIPGQIPIKRKVIERGMFVKHFVLEVYPLQLRLCVYPNNQGNCIRREKFSVGDTVGDVIAKTRTLFEIPDEAEVRLWNKYTLETFEQLANHQATLQDCGLYTDVLVMLEVRSPDGSWPRTRRSLRHSN